MPDLVRRFFVSCAQISEAYAARMLMKFGCDWRKIGHKGRCMKGFERTYRKGKIRYRKIQREHKKEKGEGRWLKEKRS